MFKPPSTSTTTGSSAVASLVSPPPSLPCAPLPQQTTRPSVSSAQMCSLPTATWATPSRSTADSSADFWPSPLPQHLRAPDACTAQVRFPMHATSTTSPNTDTSPSRCSRLLCITGSVPPVPSCASPFPPQHFNSLSSKATHVCQSPAARTFATRNFPSTTGGNSSLAICRDTSGPCPTWPALLSPTQYTAPGALRKQLCRLPTAASTIRALRAAAGTAVLD
mmetsp:Transcript_96091/g.256790  ORF Transcript_96091/g.256790 Transcript_96091/m.256790 type:complete len:222 (+) Transcript_96091:53-718(+)